MKRILIISDFFFPSTEIGAVRPSKISQRLKDNGYKVDVFTRYPIGNKEKEYCTGLYSFEEKCQQPVGGHNLYSAENFGVKSLFKKYFVFLYRPLSKAKNTLVRFREDHKMLKNFKRFVQVNATEYDTVFSSFGPPGSLLCGMYYKKKYPSVKWICDFRDPAVIEKHGFIRNFFMKIIEKRACKAADEIVAVSNGYIKRICGDNFKEKRHMIPNGYDKDDMIYSKDIPEEKGCLQLSYVGFLYGSDRDITPLFKAVKELTDSGEVDAKKIKFNYAGTDARNFYHQTRQYLSDENIVNHGILPREECLKMQFSSDILILSTWNTKKEYGVFPGKFLEYMLIGKPVVALVAGDMPDSEVAQVMRDGNFGIVYEETNAKEDFAALKEYIKQQYNHKINGEQLPFNPDKNVLERYNYDNIIMQIEDII